MGKGLLIMLIIIVATAGSTSAISVKDILTSSTNAALGLYSREVMPIDGWAKVKKGDALIVHGEAFWNPDYYIIFIKGKVRFFGPIPTGVDVSVEAYKVYFGILAVPAGNYDDIWWTRKRIGGGWVGDFFVSGFQWRWLGGESDVGQAWIAYNSPGITDLTQNISREINDSLEVQGLEGKELKVVDWDGMKKLQVGDIYILR